MWIILATVSIWLLSTQQALAYLDPGTGSILLQGIIAALSTVVVSISLGWRYIKNAITSILHRFSKRSANPPGHKRDISE